MSGWPSSTSTRGSTIAAWKHRASRWSHKARSVRPPKRARIEGEGIVAADRAELHREIARSNGD